MGNKRDHSQQAVIENQVLRVSDYEEVLYTDEGVAVYLGTLPSGAILYDVIVNITTLFNDSGTDYLTVGTATDDDAYVDDMTLAAAVCLNAIQETTPLLPLVMTADTPIYALYTGQNNNASTGACQVSLVWAPNGRKGLKVTL